MGKVLIEVKLGDYEFYCNKCKKIHKQSPYCIAQKCMGHEVIFTCDCGNKIEVIDNKECFNYGIFTKCDELVCNECDNFDSNK